METSKIKNFWGAQKSAKISDKREIILYAVTVFSLIAFIYVVSGAFLKVPGMTNRGASGLTGNAVLELDDSFKVGESFEGNVIVNEKDGDYYGILFLTKGDRQIITKNFNLRDIPKTEISSDRSLIKIRDLVNYQFQESGNYELMVSVLDLDINVQKRFMVR